MKKQKETRTPFYALAISDQIRKEKRIAELKKLVKNSRENVKR